MLNLHGKEYAFSTYQYEATLEAIHTVTRKEKFPDPINPDGIPVSEVLESTPTYVIFQRKRTLKSTFPILPSFQEPQRLSNGLIIFTGSEQQPIN